MGGSKSTHVSIFIITENKFSETRAEQMGIDCENALIFKGIPTIEDGCLEIKRILDDF